MVIYLSSKPPHNDLNLIVTAVGEKDETAYHQSFSHLNIYRHAQNIPDR